MRTSYTQTLSQKQYCKVFNCTNWLVSAESLKAGICVNCRRKDSSSVQGPAMDDRNLPYKDGIMDMPPSGVQHLLRMEEPDEYLP